MKANRQDTGQYEQIRQWLQKKHEDVKTQLKVLMDSDVNTTQARDEYRAVVMFEEFLKGLQFPGELENGLVCILRDVCSSCEFGI